MDTRGVRIVDHGRCLTGVDRDHRGIFLGGNPGLGILHRRFFARFLGGRGDLRIVHRGGGGLWASDPIDLFFLQVQGSGRIELPDGSQARIGYADHNWHPYQSIGRWLISQGQLSADKASMEGIKQWARDNPSRLAEMLNSNPSYVFFRELPASYSGPIGALGVPVSEGRSIAIDPAHVPLGAPVFLATSWPLSERPLNRLVMAQDTGGAIKEPVRVDFFWGFGAKAGAEAGRMRQQGQVWVLLPRGSTPSEMLKKP